MVRVKSSSVGVVVAALSVCLSPTVVYQLMLSRTTPLSFPVDLRPGVAVRSTSFSVPMNSVYELRLTVDTPLPDELSCYIDRVFAEHCKGDPVDLSWRVVNASQTVTSGSSRDDRGVVGGGGSVSRVLGRAELEIGSKYVVEVSSQVDASRLGALHPRIEVAMAFAAADRYLQWAGLAATIGQWLLVACSVAAVILLWNRRSRLQRLGPQLS